MNYSGVQRFFFILLQCNYRIVSWDCSPWLAPRLTTESHHDIWTIFLTICLSFDNRDMTSHAKCDTGLAQTGVDWKCTDKMKLLIVHSAINQQLQTVQQGLVFKADMGFCMITHGRRSEINK